MVDVKGRLEKDLKKAKAQIKGKKKLKGDSQLELQYLFMTMVQTTPEYIQSQKKFLKKCEKYEKKIDLESDELIALHWQLNQQDIQAYLSGRTDIYFLSCDQVRTDYYIARIMQGNNQKFKGQLTQGQIEIPLPEDEIRKVPKKQMHKELVNLKKNEQYLASERAFLKKCEKQKAQIDNDGLIALHYHLNYKDIQAVLGGEEDINTFLGSDQCKMDYIIARIVNDNQAWIRGVTSGKIDVMKLKTSGAKKQQKIKIDENKNKVKGNSSIKNPRQAKAVPHKSSFKGKIKLTKELKEHLRSNDSHQNTYDNLIEKIALVLKDINDPKVEAKVLSKFKESQTTFHVKTIHLWVKGEKVKMNKK